MTIELFPRVFVSTAKPVSPVKVAGVPLQPIEADASNDNARRGRGAGTTPAGDESKRRSVGRAVIDRATARAWVEAGYMPIGRYVEICDESVVTPPVTVSNFGEGEV